MAFTQRQNELMDKYQSLPGWEKNAYNLLAVWFGPTNEPEFQTLLRTTAWRKFTRAQGLDAQYMHDHWNRLELIEEEHDPLSWGDWRAAAPIRELIARQTVEAGDFRPLCDVAETQIKMPAVRSDGTRRFRRLWHVVYFARKALYLQNAAGLRELGVGELRQFLGADWAYRLAREVLTAPFDVSLLEKLSPDLRFPLCHIAARYAEDRETRRTATLKELEICLASPDEDRATVAAHMLCRTGAFEDALRLREYLPKTEQNWLAAVDALTRGKQAEAKTYFERLARTPRESASSGLIAADPWELFYVPLLASLGETPAKIESACRRAAKRPDNGNDGLLYDLQTILAETTSDTEALFRQQPLVRKTDSLVETARQEAGKLDGAASASVLQHTGLLLTPPAIAHLLFLAYWLAPELAKKWLPLYEELASQLDAAGMTFFASELLAAARTISGNAKEDEWHPLRDLLRRKPAWEKSLDAIEHLAGLAPGTRGKKGARRLLWLVDWTPDESAGNGRVVPGVTALEQSFQAGGTWSKGRKVALSTIASGFARIPDLPDADRRVRDAVIEHADYSGYGYYDSKSYEMDDARALLLLFGNPNVVRAADFAPLEIVRAEPRLELTEKDGVCELRLLPRRIGEEDIVVEEETPTRLRVTPFDDSQAQLAALLAQGVTVPVQGRARLLKAVSALSGLVSVQSDAAELAETVPEVKCDDTLRARLSPAGDGLTVEFVTRPFGPDGMSCRPGGGAAVLFGTVRNGDGTVERARVSRDLAGEAEKLKACASACPVLENCENEGGAVWTVPDPEDCLELLLQLKSVPGLVLEWPRGGAITVRAELDGATLAGAAQASGTDWFALSGTLKVDDELTLSLKQLFGLLKSRKSRFIELGEGQYVALTREFERRIEQLASLADEKSGALRVSPLAAPTVDELFGEGALAADANWRAMCDRFREAARMEPEIPRTLHATLRAYQTEGYRWLARLAYCGAGACLADEMGLGKTVQTLALLLARAPDGPALIVSPTSVCGNWRDEAARFAPTLNVIDYRTSGREKTLEQLGPFDAVLVSYGLLQSDAEAFSHVHWHTAVLDEAQAVKNMATKRSAAVMDLKSDFRMIMTGTPVENRLSELWNLFRFLNPGLLGSLERFNRVFASPIADGDERARARLRRVVSPFLLRRTKEQVLDDLPPRTEITLKVDLSEQERAFYEALRASAAEAVHSAGEMQTQDKRFVIFAQLMRLRRCCCAVSLVSEAAQIGANIPSSKQAALLELAARLHENGHRALVFSQFTDHLALIRKTLEGAGFECLYLDGATPAAKRTELVAQFQSGRGDFFLISLRAGGTGLNLTGADYVIHMDPWWNPAVEDQASDRAHRIGQKRPVTVYRLVARDTVEEKIVELHRTKRELASDVLDGAASPASLDLAALSALLRDDD